MYLYKVTKRYHNFVVVSHHYTIHRDYIKYSSIEVMFYKNFKQGREK